MTAQQRESILAAIWPASLPSGMKTFAVLDGARDSRIWAEVNATFCEHCCLFAGDLPRALESAAPYLVKLERDDWLARFIVENGWGKSWGIFVRADSTFKSLRKHLRRFLRVNDEQGRRFLFRYYDPRVLRIYLPTCTSAELQMLFGLVDGFLMEDEAAHGVLEMKFNGGLVASSIPVNA